MQSENPLPVVVELFLYFLTVCALVCVCVRVFYCTNRGPPSHPSLPGTYLCVWGCLVWISICGRPAALWPTEGARPGLEWSAGGLWGLWWLGGEGEFAEEGRGKAGKQGRLAY